MPRTTVLLTPEPPRGDAILRVAEGVRSERLGGDAEPLEALMLDDGAALQVVAGGETLVTVLPARLLPQLDEVGRLLPGAAPPGGTRWWTDAYAPHRPDDALGAAILEAVAAASGGIAFHTDHTDHPQNP